MKKKDVIKALSGSITGEDLLDMLNNASDIYELLGDDFNIDNDDIAEVIASLATINVLSSALASKLKIEAEVNEAEEGLILDIITANCTDNETGLDNEYDFYDDDYDDELFEDFDDSESEDDFDDLDIEDFDSTDEEDYDTEEDLKDLDDIFGKSKDREDDNKNSGDFIEDGVKQSEGKYDHSTEYRIDPTEAFLSAFDVFNESDEID